jgi:hypothetical protein
MDRRSRIVVTGGLVAALVAPVLLDRDGFPLSTYPMYARARSESVVLATAQGVAADGTRLQLSAGEIGASDDPLIVAGELRDAIARGRADERCAEIASRVAGRVPEDDRADTGARGATAVTVEVVTERHDVIARAGGDDSLLGREVHAACEVQP